MFDDAEKKIARLMRESTTTGESKSGLGTINVRGRGNLVALGAINVTINLYAADQSATDAGPDGSWTSAEIPNKEIALDLTRLWTY